MADVKSNPAKKVAVAIMLFIVIVALYWFVVRPWLKNRAVPLPTNPLLVAALAKYRIDMLNWLKGTKPDWYKNLKAANGNVDPSDEMLLANIDYSGKTTDVIYTYDENGVAKWRGPVKQLYGY